MNLVRRQVGDVVVLDLLGRLISTDDPDLLTNAVDDLLADGRTHIVLNLSELTYVDSGGLGQIISSHLRTAKISGALKLAQPTARVADLLVITRLVIVLDTYETVQLAVDSFAAPAESAAVAAG